MSADEIAKRFIGFELNGVRGAPLVRGEKENDFLQEVAKDALDTSESLGVLQLAPEELPYNGRA